MLRLTIVLEELIPIRKQHVLCLNKLLKKSALASLVEIIYVSSNSCHRSLLVGLDEAQHKRRTRLHFTTSPTLTLFLKSLPLYTKKNIN